MVEVNLLPQQYRKQSQPSAWRFATYALLPLTLAAIAIPEALTASTIRDLRGQIDALNGEITTLTPAKREFDDLKREQTTLEQVTAVAGQLRDQKTYWSNDIAAFSAQLPTGSGVSVKTMSVRPVDPAALASQQQAGIYSGKNVVREFDLSGTASSQQAVVNFLNTFENNPNFGVNFKNLQRDPDGGLYSFSATVGIVAQPPASTTPAAGTSGTVTPAAAPAAPTSPGGTSGVQ
ncbi:fimbrial assembly protein [Deinococcus navajonensis]|uniref:Fimbrial assembly protein n=1 Tax=Deinococcus navajonensis TaxID=309884 RepID=A0ABV8XML3_9DEIO